MEAKTVFNLWYANMELNCSSGMTTNFFPLESFMFWAVIVF